MQNGIKSLSKRWMMLITYGAVAGLIYVPFISEIYSLSVALAFATQGVLVVLLAIEGDRYILRGRRDETLRRAPFVVMFAVKTLITTVLIVVAYSLGGLFLFPRRFVEELALQGLIRDTGLALITSAVFQFLSMVRNIVGGRVLTNIIFGRYHQPLSEERLFMFIDVKGSTALAERLGGVGAYSMISRFFFDVAEVTRRYGGETHDYIGDEVIVTWPLDRGLENGLCLQCYFAICDRITSKAPDYLRDFDQVPQFRVGLHGGPVVAGECGSDKLAIVYFGDTINTAARIQEACKEFRHPLLVSGEVVSRMNLGSEYCSTSLGNVRLRGREREIELFTIEQQLSGQLTA